MRKKDFTKKLHKIDKFLLKDFKKAIDKYEMIKDGDKILVGFSGGKDSTAAAILLAYYQTISGKKFEIKAVAINYGMPSESYARQIENLRRFGIDALEYPSNIFELAQTKMDKNSSMCSFFSRLRRGMLTQAAKEFDCNKIALGHHFDDAAESLLMGILKNGKIRSLTPIYKNKYNQIIIRPLILTREKKLADFCKENGFETLGDEMCPGICMGALPVAREEMKKLLLKLEKKDKNVMSSIKNAMESLDDETLLDKNRNIFLKKKFWRKIF